MSQPAVLWAASQGAAALALVATILLMGWHFGMRENDLRALVFTALVLMNVGLIVVNRSFRSSLYEAVLRPNPALWALVAPLLVVLPVALYWAPAQALFQFGPLHVDDLSVCVLAVIGVVAILEVYKSLGFGRRLAFN
jgi:Ca2+-transporting ATPase